MPACQPAVMPERLPVKGGKRPANEYAFVIYTEEER
jgi:hypothetical protein